VNINEKINFALTAVAEAPLIAFDTETSGVDWRKNFPIGYVITSFLGSVYIPVRHGTGGNVNDPAGNSGAPSMEDGPWQIHSFERDLAKAFQERQRNGHPTIGHNVKFDCHFAANAGIMLGRDLYDTSITQGLIDEYTRDFSLAALAEQYDVTAKKGDEMYAHIARKLGFNVGIADKKQMANYWRLPGNDPMVVEYAEADGKATLELHMAQMDKVAEQDLVQVHRLESQLIWTLFRMERRGVKIDLDWCEELDDLVEAHVRLAAADLPEGFNTRSAKDMHDYMVKLGRTDWPTTEKGNPSFNEHWLKTFPEGMAVLRHRQWSNLRNMFLGPLVEEHTHNGRVNPQINQLRGDDYGTVSGRLSCSMPNLQQLPKRNKEVAKPFRKAFVADEGYVFYERDYSQCEPRLYAHYSKDEHLLAGYNSEPFEDMHSVVSDLLQVPRQTAKTLNMGILGLMGPKSLARHMGIPLYEAENLWNRWFATFPGIRKFQSQAADVFGKRGYVKTLLGRRCRLEAQKFSYRAANRIIQGGNADIIKQKMLEIDMYLESIGDEAQMLMAVHDSLAYQCPEGREDISEEIGRIMADVQGDPFRLSIPFTTDVGSGKNWSEAAFGGE